MFSVQDIKSAAMEASGLNDFGDRGFEEPLAILVKAYDQDVRLSETGEQAVRRELISNLIGRLRVVDGLKKSPEALNEKIERPIFILGFPRTGTTTLHNMVQTNPDFQVLENWLGAFPKSRPPRDQWETDTDYLTVANGLRQLYETNPELRAQHDISADGADECSFLFKHLLMDDAYGYLCDLPSYWEWFDKQSMVHAYRWHQNVLKLIQYPYDTGRRWVLKYPTHLAWIDALFEVYPDACVIQTHRDPAATIPSFASLICNASGTFSDSRSPQQLGPFLAKQWHDRVNGFMQARAALGRESQFADLQFEDVMSDPVAGLKRAFEHFGVDLSEQAETGMKDWLKKNPPGRHGGHKYTAEEFGLDFNLLSDSFRSYRERFGVTGMKR